MGQPILEEGDKLPRYGRVSATRPTLESLGTSQLKERSHIKIFGHPTATFTIRNPKAHFAPWATKFESTIFASMALNMKAKRARVLIACDRCRIRKRKCDGQQPCSCCKSANKACVYEDRKQPYHVEYSPEDEQKRTILLDEISSLKLELSSMENQLSGVQDQLEQKNKELIELQRTVSELRQNAAVTSTFLPAVGSIILDKTFATALGRVLFHNEGEEYEYIGSFAIISIAKSIKNALGVRSTPSRPSVVLNTGYQAGIHVPDYLEDEMLEEFLNVAHNRYYFVEPEWLRSIPKKQMDLRSHWEMFVLNICLGVGCRLGELWNSTNYPSSDFYLREAMTHLSQVDMKPLEQIQACALTSLFIARSYNLSFYISSWELAGLAMRKMIGYGFHRRRRIVPEKARKYEINKRLFWSIYNLEKLLSLSLGRPSVVNEVFIDIPLPLSFKLPLHPTDADIRELWNMQIAEEKESLTTSAPSRPMSCYTPFLETVVVRQLESRVHLLFYSVNRFVPNADNFQSITEAIEKWYSALPTKEEFDLVMKGEDSYTYLTVLYYRAKLLLLLPKIIISKGEQRSALLCHACVAAAGACTNYMVLYKERLLGFTMIAFHTLFLAGITMVYYIKLYGYPEFVNLKGPIRDCTSLLFIWSERWPECASYRDLMDGILSFIEQRENSSSPVSGSPLNQQVSDQRISLDLESNMTEDFWDQVMQDLHSRSPIWPC